MYILRENPILTKNGKISGLLKIENNVLTIENKIKFENNKWYTLGENDNKWYFVGLGGIPSYMVENSINDELFQNVFMEVEDNERTN